ncbi:retrotransposon gag domain, retroviral aspartyl protease [Tanacetum coccineum]
MVQTRSNLDEGNLPLDLIATQLAIIAKKLESIEPEHCLLGVLLNGLKEELKADVRIQKPRTVYKAVSIALEFESKISHTRYGKGSTWAASSKTNQPEPKGTTSVTTSTNRTSKPPLRISVADRQSRYLKGECYRCGENNELGHRCKTSTLKVLEVEEEFEEQLNNEVEYMAGEPNEVAEISLHAILGKPHPRTMKVQGGVDLVLEIQWLETLNTVQANWKEMFMIFNVEGHVIIGEGVHVEQEKVADVQCGQLLLMSKKFTGFSVSQALNAFTTLKQALLSTLVLRLPDFSKTFVVEYDASSAGVGAILSQEEHPVTYFTYELELPADAKIHPVFYVSMLKPAHGSFPQDMIALLPITKDWEIDVQPASIIDHRWILEAGQPVLELLVSWNQRPIEEAT